MAKTLLVSAPAGEIVAGAGGNSFAVIDLTAPLTLRVEGLRAGDSINVVVQNFAGDGWVPWTDGDGAVQLNSRRQSVTPMEIGIFSTEGIIGDPVTLYTEDAS